MANALAAIRTVTFAVVAALLLTVLLSPVYRGLRRLRLPGWLSSLVTVLLLVAALTVSLAFVVNRAMGQVTDLRRAVGQGVRQFRHMLKTPALGPSDRQLDRLEGMVIGYL